MDEDAVKIEVHSREGCPHCVSVREFLTEKGLTFVEVKHDDEQERQAFYDSLGLVNMEGQPPARTVPQVIVVAAGSRFRIGGAKETMNSGIESLKYMQT